jgi:hypothetical protein
MPDLPDCQAGPGPDLPQIGPWLRDLDLDQLSRVPLPDDDCGRWAGYWPVERCCGSPASFQSVWDLYPR